MGKKRKYAVLIGSKVIGTTISKSSNTINKVLAGYIKKKKTVRVSKIRTR